MTTELDMDDRVQIEELAGQWEERTLLLAEQTRHLNDEFREVLRESNSVAQVVGVSETPTIDAATIVDGGINFEPLPKPAVFYPQPEVACYLNPPAFVGWNRVSSHECWETRFKHVNEADPATGRMVVTACVETPATDHQSTAAHSGGYQLHRFDGRPVRDAVGNAVVNFLVATQVQWEMVPGGSCRFELALKLRVETIVGSSQASTLERWLVPRQRLRLDHTTDGATGLRSIVIPTPYNGPNGPIWLEETRFTLAANARHFIIVDLWVHAAAPPGCKAAIQAAFRTVSWQ